MERNEVSEGLFVVSRLDSGGVWLGEQLRSFAAKAGERFPDSAREEILGSFNRLRKVHSVSDASAAMYTEVERLLQVSTPLFVRHPLPLDNARAAKLVVGAAAAAAAAVEEAEGLAALVSFGGTIPTLPLAVAGAFIAVAAEAYVAASLRVNNLRRAGLEVSAEAVAVDVALAMAGGKGGGGGLRHGVTKSMIKRIVRRLVRREVAGLLPAIGVVYGVWDSRSTIDAIDRMPLPPRPVESV